MSDKYAAIAAHQGQYPVRLMGEVLGVSPSGFYAAEGRAPGARAAADERLDERLRGEVRAAHRKSQGRYGAPARAHDRQRARPAGRAQRARA